MRIHVCSKLSIPEANRTLPRWDSLGELGHEYSVSDKDIPKTRPDVVISMGVGVMEYTERVLSAHPGVSLYCYNWDCYEWVWNTPRPGEYDYNRYGELLRRATEIWVPSYCTGRRTSQWWDLHDWVVILSCCPYWDYEKPIEDHGYVLCTLREIPDPRWGWFERACRELDIPYRMTQHKQNYESYQYHVANCRSLVSHLHELSTGGLSLLEGYYLGKPVLLNNSEWHGGRDYFGTRAIYFSDDSYADFKNCVETCYEDPPIVPSDYKQWVASSYSDEVMVDKMLKRVWMHGF